MDMTQVLVEGFGWIDIVVVLDGYTTVVVGYQVGIQCPSPQWLAALNMAVSRQFPDGVRGQSVPLMRDDGCQPTSVAFQDVGRALEIQPALTSDHNPQGNADTERWTRTLTEGCLWLQEWTCPLALVKILEGWIDQYHEHDLHSAVGYKTPRPFERDDHRCHRPPCIAACSPGPRRDHDVHRAPTALEAMDVR
jgi:putative transposase